MTIKELAGVYRRLADSLDRFVESEIVLDKGADEKPIVEASPLLQGDFAVGAMILWGYFYDLARESNRETFTKEDIVNILELTSKDAELFTPGTIRMMWDSWNETTQQLESEKTAA